MKKLLFLFALLFSTAGTIAAQSPSASECSHFRTGTFTYKNFPNVIIERDSLFQTETDPSTGSVVKMSIKWTSPCTYELRLVHANKHKDRKFWRRIKVLVVTITYTEEDRYRFSCVSPAIPEPITGTIILKKK